MELVTTLVTVPLIAVIMEERLRAHAASVVTRLAEAGVVGAPTAVITFQIVDAMHAIDRCSLSTKSLKRTAGVI